MSSRKRTRSEEDCDSHVTNLINGVEYCDSYVTNMINGVVSRKKIPKADEKASPSDNSAVHDEASPPTAESKFSANRGALDPISLSFSNDHEGEPESSIVMNRLKDLCSKKEPTLNVVIEIVGAAIHILKLMTKRGSCDDKIWLAVRQAVEASEKLFHADHLRNNALQLLSKGQELFDK